MLKTETRQVPSHLCIYVHVLNKFKQSVLLVLSVHTEVNNNKMMLFME